MGRKRPPKYIVIRDTREKTGYYFKEFNQCEGMIEGKLDTGDYSIQGLEDKVCVERKASPAELAINLGKDKHRFLKEIERMKSFEHKYIVLEFSMEDLRKFPEGSDIPEKQKQFLKMTGKYILRCLMEFEIFDDINVVFCGDKDSAFVYVSSLFKRINEKYSIGRTK